MDASRAAPVVGKGAGDVARERTQRTGIRAGRRRWWGKDARRRWSARLIFLDDEMDLGELPMVIRVWWPVLLRLFFKADGNPAGCWWLP
jgi:hypothetical protein